MDSRAGIIELDQLIGLFYTDHSELGIFSVVGASEIPEPQRSLLDHNLHMTETVEKFHSSAVDVIVLQHRLEPESYYREICLARQSDGQIVQYGIVRLDFRQLDALICSEIMRHEKPLGKILIDHEVLRRVQLFSLYRIKPAVKLAAALGIPVGETCFGRTAIIHCNHEPAIELLEIVRA